MKRFIASFVVVAAVALVPLTSHASILSNILNALNRGNLQAAVGAAANVDTATDLDPDAGNTVIPTCINLTKYLLVGSKDATTGGQVSDLQLFLQNAGYLKSDPTGYFGAVTRDALKAYQVARGLVSTGDPKTTGFGATGPKTRKTINAESCGTTIPVATPTPTGTPRPSFTPSPSPTPRPSVTPSPSVTPTVTAALFNLSSVQVGSTNLGTNIQYSVVYDGATRDPAYISLNLICPVGVAAVVSGDNDNVCNKTLRMIAVRNGLFQLTVNFKNMNAQASTVGAEAHMNGLNGAGNSDKDAVSIAGTNSNTPLITVVSPNGGESFQTNQTGNINFSWRWGGSGTPKEPTAYIVDLSGNVLYGSVLSYDDPAKSSRTGVMPSAVCSVFPNGCVAGLAVGGKYKIKVCEFPAGSNNPAYPGTPVCDESDSPFTITAPVSTQTGPTVTVAGSPTLALTYDGAQKESNLTATFNLNVVAGNKTLHILKNSANLSFFDQSNKNIYTNSNKNIVVPITALSQTTDVYGQVVYTIPAGQTAMLQVIGTVNPQQLFGGTYHAVLQAIVNDTNETANLFEYLYLKEAVTNTKTVVGEVAPYLTSATFTSDGLVQISGVRFVTGNNTVNIGGRVYTAAPVSNGTSADILAVRVTGVTSGNYPVNVINPLLGDVAGKSNTVYVTIVGSPVAPPVVTVNSANLKLSYDSAQRESSLVGTFTGSIKAGASEVRLVDNALWIRTDGGQNSDNVNGSNHVTTYSGIGVQSYTDTYGRKIYIIPAGTTFTFTAIKTLNPQYLYAGTYTESLKEFYGVDQSGTQLTFPVTIGTQITNAVTVVGESAPAPTPTPTPAQPSATFIVPIGGENIKAGADIVVRGTVVGMERSTTVQVLLVDSAGNETPLRTSANWACSNNYCIGFIASTGIRVTVPSTSPAGSYAIRAKFSYDGTPLLTATSASFNVTQ
jgi:hypothetical protein